MGDFNSRNTSWGCNITDSRGKTIEQIIENEQSLILLNNGDPTRYNSFNGSLSAVDLTITSSNLVPPMEWQIQTSYSGSDHWLIEIRIQNKSTSYDPPLKWNLSKPNWKLFSELVEHDLILNPIDLNVNITQEHIDSIVNDFSNIILKAANIAIGIKSRNNKLRTTPWWNSECNNAIKKYKQALNRFKKTKDPLDHILLKKSRAEARYITKTSKTLSWKNFTSTIYHKIDPSALWNKIRTLKGYKSPPIPDRLRDNLNKIYSSSDSVSEAFAQFFQNNNSNQNYSDEFLAYKNSYSSLSIDSPSTNEHCFNLPLNLSELLSGLQNSKSKSPGPDKIPNSFIQNLSENELSTLLQIFNSIWTHAKSWKKSSTRDSSDSLNRQIESQTNNAASDGIILPWTTYLHSTLTSVQPSKETNISF
ncbi:hypothetical protein QTP88_019260 [Uroleucon formosanum]